MQRFESRRPSQAVWSLCGLYLAQKKAPPWSGASLSHSSGLPTRHPNPSGTISVWIVPRCKYTRIARSFFAISSEREGVILYSRCNFSKRGRGAIHCFDLLYPQEEKRSWDAVVTRISLSLRPLEG